jgi:hypothetical protein
VGGGGYPCKRALKKRLINRLCQYYGTSSIAELTANNNMTLIATSSSNGGKTSNFSFVRGICQIYEQRLLTFRILMSTIFDVPHR